MPRNEEKSVRFSSIRFGAEVQNMKLHFKEKIPC